MDDLLKMPISEYNSILFSIVGINDEKKSEIEKQKAGIKT